MLGPEDAPGGTAQVYRPVPAPAETDRHLSVNASVRVAFVVFSTKSYLTLLGGLSVARQALSWGFSGKRYWSGFAILYLGGSLELGMNTVLHWLSGFFIAEPPGSHSDKGNHSQNAFIWKM